MAFGHRHCVIILISLGLGALYAMRSSFSIALVAMVNDVPKIDNFTTDDECPLPYITVDNTSAADAMTQNSTIPTFPWPRDVQGYILSSFYWGYVISQVPAGILARRFGGKWILAAGTAWAIIIVALTPLIARLGAWYLVASRILRGLGEGFTYPAVNALLGQWVPRAESSFLFMIANIGLQIGTVIGQMIAGQLCASSWGWPSVFYATSGLGVLWLVLWCALSADNPAKHPCISPAERQLIEDSTGCNNDDQSTRKAAVPWCRILSDPAVWAYTVCAFANGWKTYLLLSCLPQFLSDVLHFNIQSNGLLSSLPFIANLIFQILASRLADYIINTDRFSRTCVRRSFSVTGQLGVAAFMLATTYVGCNAIATVAMLVLMQSLQAIDAGGFLPNALDLSPEFAGVLFGIANTFGITAGILAPQVTDLITIHHTRNEWRIVFFITTGIASVSALIYGVFGSGDRRDYLNTSEEEKPLLSN